MAAPPKVVVVAIDQATIDAWSIPKAAWPGKFAVLLEELDRLGARRIAFDYVIETDIDDYLSDMGSAATPLADFTTVVERLGPRIVLGTDGGSEIPGQLLSVPNLALASVAVAGSTGRAVLTLPRYDLHFAPPLQGLASRLVEPATPRADAIAINYGGRPIQTLSAIDVIENRIQGNPIRGAYVLVGSTYDASLDNRHSTPFSPWTPGVMVNAEAADTILGQRELINPAPWVGSIAAALTGLLGGVFAYRAPPLTYLVSALVAGALGCWAAFAAFGRINHVWPLFLPLAIALLAVPAVVYSVRAVEERLKAARAEVKAMKTRREWSVFMPEEFIQRVEQNSMKGLGAWDDLDACILFMDIADSSEHTNAMGGRQVVGPLNAIFCAVIEEVHRGGGLILNFMGDGLSAMFEIKTPADGDRIRQRALDCCWRVFHRVQNLNETGALGDRTFDIRLGLSSGLVNVALIGSQDRRQMTIYGPAVNIAARCEQAGKRLNPDEQPSVTSRLVVSDEFAPLLDGSGRTFLPVSYSPRGWLDPVRLYYWSETQAPVTMAIDANGA